MGSFMGLAFYTTKLEIYANRLEVENANLKIENSKLKEISKVKVDEEKLDKVLGVVTVYCAHLFFDTNDKQCCARNCNECFFSSKEKLKKWIRKED